MGGCFRAFEELLSCRRVGPWGRFSRQPHLHSAEARHLQLSIVRRSNTHALVHTGHPCRKLCSIGLARNCITSEGWWTTSAEPTSSPPISFFLLSLPPLPGSAGASWSPLPISWEAGTFQVELRCE